MKQEQILQAAIAGLGIGVAFGAKIGWSVANAYHMRHYHKAMERNELIHDIATYMIEGNKDVTITHDEYMAKLEEKVLYFDIVQGM